MHGDPDGLPLERLAGTDLWHLRLPVPKGARASSTSSTSCGTATGAWINDPLNPRRRDRSVRRQLGVPEPSATRRRHGPGRTRRLRPGRIETLSDRERAPSARRAWFGVYLPAGFAEDRRYPPADRPRRRRTSSTMPGSTTVLDNLIHRGDVPPFDRGADAAGRADGEYTGDPRHADFVDRGCAARPAGAPSRCARTRPACVLMGSSLGAVASLATAFRHPGRLRRAGPALRLLHLRPTAAARTRDPLFGRIADFVDRHPRRSRATFRGAIFVELRHLRRARSGRTARSRASSGSEAREVRFLETRDGAPLAELARPAAGRPDLDLARTAAASATSKTARERPERADDKNEKPAPAGRGEDAVAEITRTIGLSLGADICWPICYEELVRRLDLADPP